MTYRCHVTMVYYVQIFFFVQILSLRCTSKSFFLCSLFHFIFLLYFVASIILQTASWFLLIVMTDISELHCIFLIFWFCKVKNLTSLNTGCEYKHPVTVSKSFSVIFVYHKVPFWGKIWFVFVTVFVVCSFVIPVCKDHICLGVVIRNIFLCLLFNSIFLICLIAQEVQTSWTIKQIDKILLNNWMNKLDCYPLLALTYYGWMLNLSFQNLVFPNYQHESSSVLQFDKILYHNYSF